MKKFFKKIHLWLSIPLGILIIIICLTGAILVFRTEIEETTNRDIVFTKEGQSQGERLTLAELISIANTQFEDDRVTGVIIPSDPKRNYTISVASNMRETIYINPYTGEVLGKIKDGFFSKIMPIHRWLLIKREAGKPIVGYTTLIMVVILISGLIIIFPKSRKQLKRIFSISFTKGWKRFWYDLHVSGGMYVIIGLLVLALTGLTWSFQWYRVPFYRLFGAEITQQVGHALQPQSNNVQQRPEQGNSERIPQNPKEQKSEERSGRPERDESKRHILQEAEEQKPEYRGNRPERNSEILAMEQAEKHPQQNKAERQIPSSGERTQSTQRRQEPANPIHWDEVLAYVQAENPNFKRINIRNNSVSVTQNKWGNSRATDHYSFDGETGEITEHIPYKNQDRTTKVRGWIYSIHVGSWGGMFSKIITFLIALTGALLPITGYYLWIKRLNYKKAN